LHFPGNLEAAAPPSVFLTEIVQLHQCYGRRLPLTRLLERGYLVSNYSHTYDCTMQKSRRTSRFMKHKLQIAHSTYESQSSNSIIFSPQVATVHHAPLSQSRAHQRVSGRLALPSTRLSDVCIHIHEGGSRKPSSALIKGGDGTRGSPSDPFSCQYILITSFP
jgi:hypothetical protein